jgi:hypothetical protein
LKNVDNTCRRAKKCLKGLFTGKQTNALVNVYYIILAPVGVILEHLRCPENVWFLLFYANKNYSPGRNETMTIF